jgi:hypothetical protein
MSRVPEPKPPEHVGIRRNHRLFDEWSVDLIDLPLTKLKHRYCLVMVDAVSGWPEALPLHSRNSNEIAGALIHVLSRYGGSRRLRSDREFLSAAVGAVVLCFTSIILQLQPTTHLQMGR